MDCRIKPESRKGLRAMNGASGDTEHVVVAHWHNGAGEVGKPRALGRAETTGGASRFAPSLAPRVGMTRPPAPLTQRIEPLPGPDRSRVCIYATDPLAAAGVAFHLERAGSMVLVDADAVNRDTVVIAVADELDDRLALELVTAKRLSVRGAVLVIDQLGANALLRALGVGVRAVIWRREVGGEELRRAVAAVAAGDGCLPPELLGDLLRVLGHRPASAPPPTVQLTDREAEVLRLLADGYGTAEIARRLAYSERTIKAILHGVTERLHLRNRTHAVAFLARQGLL